MHTICLKIRLLPTKAQETVLNTTLETCRILYNRLLAERKDAWEQSKSSLSCFEQQKHIKAWAQGHEYLPRVHSQVLQNVAVRVDLAFKAFFRRCKAGETAGYPRFRGFGRCDSYTHPQSGFALLDNAVRLSKIGTLKAIAHRTVEGKIKTCTVRRQNGKWFAYFAIEVAEQPLPESSETVGIDVGLSHFATLSSGEQIPNPRFYRQDEKALAKAQRRMSKFEKGSKERRRARKVVARIHERIRNRRHNFTHQTARRIVKRYSVIAVEKLSPKKMIKNHCLAKSIGDAAWSQFRTVLSNKAENAGRKLIAVNPAYTSQTCYQCGHVAKKKLSQRWHFCPMCSASLDRDHNAALNILSLGLQRLGIQSIEAPPFMAGE